MSQPSPLRQTAVAVLLLMGDLAVIAWLLWTYAWTGWRDAWNRQDAPTAPGVAWHAVWILAAGAVVTGIGLLALRWRIPGITQILVLGVGAALSAYWAVHR